MLTFGKRPVEQRSGRGAIVRHAAKYHDGVAHGCWHAIVPTCG